MNYRAEIDGLRALAVLPVILFHAGFELFKGGFVGVDVFFVISGYLITTIIISEIAEGKFSIINFYERRARRILPALFFVMLVCLPFAWFWLIPNDLKDFGQSLVAVSTFSSNILFWKVSGYFDTAAELYPLLHTWSIAVEEQYYILFPIFLILTWRLGIKWILVILSIVFVISLGVAHWGAFNKPIPTFYLLPTRGWELLIGVFIAFYLKHNSYLKSHSINQTLSLIGSGMIIYSIFAFDESTPFPSLFTLVPTVGTGLLILSAVPNTIVNTLLSFSPIVGVGLISYSAYLWHLPMLVFVRHRLLGELSDLLLIVLCFASLVMAYISWRWIEKPFRDKKKTTSKMIFSFSLIGIVFFSSIGLITYFKQGFYELFSEDIQRYSLIYESYKNRFANDECNLSVNLSKPPLCIIGDISVNPKIALIGDSHASAINYELDKVLQDRKISIYRFTKNSCPPALGFQSDNYEDCWRHIDNTLKVIDEKKIETVILFARWSYYLNEDPYDNNIGGIDKMANRYTILPIPLTADISERRQAILSSYKQFIDKLLSNDIKVITIGPVPEHGWDVPKRAMKNFIHRNYLGVELLPFEIYEDRNIDVINIFEDYSSRGVIYYVDSSKVFCTDNKICDPINVFKESLYWDDDHLTDNGAKILINEFINLL